MITLRNALASVIDGLKTTATFNAVYYEMPTQILTTPAVCIITEGGSETFETNQHDSLSMDFTVRIINEKQDSTDNDKASTDIVLTIGGAVLTEIRKKATMVLSGNSYYMLASKIGKIQVGTLENLNVFFMDLTITVKAIKDITS